MSLWTVIAIVCAPPIASTEIPVGTDLIVRGEVGKLAKEIQAVHATASQLGEAYPPLANALLGLDGFWRGPLARVSRHLQVDWQRPDVTVMLSIDLDAPGGLLWSAVVRGALAKKTTPQEDAGVSEFLVDEQPAYRLADADMAWSVVRDGDLVLGDERGLQRQLRQLLQPDAELLEIRREAARVRTRAPLVVIVALPETTREQIGELLPVVGPFLRAVAAGHLTADAKRVAIALRTTQESSRDAMLHGLQALVAALRARAAHLETGAEAMLGLHGLGGRELGLPGVGAEMLATLTRDWLSGYTLVATVRGRARDQVEAELSPSRMRPLAATAGYMLLGVLADVEADDDTPAAAPPKAGSRGADEAPKGSSGKAAPKGGGEKSLSTGTAEQSEQKEAGSESMSAGDEKTPRPRGGGARDKAPFVDFHRL